MKQIIVAVDSHRDAIQHMQYLSFELSKKNIGIVVCSTQKLILKTSNVEVVYHINIHNNKPKLRGKHNYDAAFGFDTFTQQNITKSRDRSNNITVLDYILKQEKEK